MCFGGVVTKVMCVVVCVSKFRVPLGALPSSWWMVYLLLLVLAALPVVICDNLGRQPHSRYISMSVDRVINCHLLLKFSP
jgi:hypothetical protein